MNPTGRGFALHEIIVATALAGVGLIAAAGAWQKTDTLTKLAQVKTDMRTMSVALEAYHAQNNEYPPCITITTSPSTNLVLLPPEKTLNRLTTPIAFLSQTYAEPFNSRQGWALYDGWDMLAQGNAPPDRATRKTIYWFAHFPDDPSVRSNLALTLTLLTQGQFSMQDISAAMSVRWTLMSPGPDGYYSFESRSQLQDSATAAIIQMLAVNMAYQQAEYDPTNGLVSNGDVARRYQTTLPPPPPFNSAKSWERY